MDNKLSVTAGFAAIVDQHARGAILRFLREAPGYTSNERVLRDALDDLGIRLSWAKLNAVLEWLAAQHLVTLNKGDVVVVALTQRGADVADDREMVEGVERKWLG